MIRAHTDWWRWWEHRRYRVACALPVSVLASLLLAAFAGEAEAWSNQDELRGSEPLEAVVEDLEAFVPDYMAQQAVPGVAMALIRDGRIGWVKGFGSANRWTGRPVLADTIFEVASNSKVMTAFIALRLVDQGKLDLDVPLNRYLAVSWMPPSKYRDVVTLRQCLSHSAGFGHNTLSREILFEPGSRFSYSAIGIMYVQDVIEKVSGESLDRLGDDLLFRPLGMASSSFVNPPRLAARAANGHVWAVVPGLIWTLVYLVSLALVIIVGWPVLRIVTHRWRPSRRAVTVGIVAAVAPPLIALLVLLGGVGLTEFAWLIGLYGMGSMAGLVLGYLLGNRVIGAVSGGRRRAVMLARVAWVVLLLVGWGWLSIELRNVPVPRWPAVKPQGAGSARTTAGDLSRFLIELARPTLLTAKTAAELRTSQVRLSDDLSWGLGPGILHTKQGDALWQWGQHIDFQSLMIIYPDVGLGAVVLTNSDLFNPDVAATIAHRAIGGKIEPLLQAIHLQFNFRDEAKSVAR